MSNLKIPEKHFHLLLNTLADKLFKNEGFRYVSKIKCDGNGPTDYTYEVGYDPNDLEFKDKVPEKVYFKEIDDSYDDNLFVCTKLLEVNKIIPDSTCSKIDNEISGEKILGGGGIKINPQTIGITTLAVVFKDDLTDRLFGLTCSHGLRDESPIFYSQKTKTKYKHIGKVYYKNPSTNMDYAIIEIFPNSIGDVNEGVLLYTNNDEIQQNIIHHKEGTPVRKYGVITQGTSGTIDSEDVSYKYKGKLLKGNYMVKGNSPCHFFADEGDSGSLVINDELKPVGIIVQIQANKSIVLPLINIIEHINENTSQKIELIFNH
ncbi:hypothetical protein [Pseudotenacibaculum haliotis]|uniref:Serine protease n=1 Tax=Pseudotenacibaculum haliotis TaxID=1862138 RepID=A0ABW5LU50_9FLAO